MPGQLVFGYGSLAAGDTPAELSGFRRRWGVAMDNRVDLPGYKFYIDAASGERPPVYVAFLDIAPAAAHVVNGVLLPAADLDALDRRERNYRRDEVAVDGGSAWAYFGSDPARERFARGLAEGSLVVSREYLEGVERGFAGLGALDRFRATTDAPPCPVVDLRRVDLP